MFMVMSTGQILNLGQIQHMPGEKPSNGDVCVRMADGSVFTMSKSDAKMVYGRLKEIAFCNIKSIDSMPPPAHSLDTGPDPIDG